MGKSCSVVAEYHIECGSYEHKHLCQLAGIDHSVLVTFITKIPPVSFIAM